MREIWDSLLGGLEQIIRAYQQVLEPVFGDFAWGWAIILLTFTVRLLLLPLAVKQTRSMRAMQSLAPEMNKIRAKHKVDRSLIRTDPQRYREQRQKQQEATMALYKEQGVNPAASCLPLVLQLPIFFALFSVLNVLPEQADNARIPELASNGWYGIQLLSARISDGLGVVGWGAVALVVLMSATTYLTQKQMMARQPAANDQMATQQKVLLYAMPVMLLVFSYGIPSGVLIYWVATNLWTMVQQWLMFRGVDDAAKAQASADAKVLAEPDRKASRGGGGAGGGKEQRREAAAPKATSRGTARSNRAAGSDRSKAGSQGAAGSSGSRKAPSRATAGSKGTTGGNGQGSASRSRRGAPTTPPAAKPVAVNGDRASKRAVDRVARRGERGAATPAPKDAEH